VIGSGTARDMAVYWGVRSERDLYAQDVLQELLGRAPRLRYVPVLSEPCARMATASRLGA
jgi:CDP-4-dehydro-6-deoxyglucose reductase